MNVLRTSSCEPRDPSWPTLAEGPISELFPRLGSDKETWRGGGKEKPRDDGGRVFHSLSPCLPLSLSSLAILELFVKRTIGGGRRWSFGVILVSVLLGAAGNSRGDETIPPEVLRKIKQASVFVKVSLGSLDH